MKTATLTIVLCVGLALSTTLAQESYTTTGGMAMAQEVTNSMPMADGNMFAETVGRGFIWTDTENVVGGNGSMNCYGSAIVNQEGMPQTGAGSCRVMDTDGDIWWAWYNGGVTGDWAVVGGTGKYEGMTGNGSWQTTAQYADGKVNNTWEGSWTIPAAMMMEEE